MQSLQSSFFCAKRIMRYNHLNIIAATTATILHFSTASSSAATSSIMTSTASADCLPPEKSQPYKVINNTKVSSDSNILTIALPTGRSILGWHPQIPTCISISKPESETGSILKKSYSPISVPSQQNTFQLLVKSYTPRIGGGVGAYLCNLKVNDVIEAKVKPQRIMHEATEVHNRWKHIGLIAGGTGIAPLYQLLMILLQDCDRSVKIHVLSINRKKEDVLLKKELDELSAKYSDRVFVTYSLTGDEDVVKDGTESSEQLYKTGRGDVQLANHALPSPAAGKEVMIFICGKDGFVEYWGGKVERAPNKPDGSKGPKIQGPLLGILKDAGYDASQVFKY